MIAATDAGAAHTIAVDVTKSTFIRKIARADEGVGYFISKYMAMHLCIILIGTIKHFYDTENCCTPNFLADFIARLHHIRMR